MGDSGDSLNPWFLLEFLWICVNGTTSFHYLPHYPCHSDFYDRIILVCHRWFAGQDYLQSYLEIICRAVSYGRKQLWVIVLVRSLDINKYEYFCICFIGIQFSNAWIYLVPSLMIQTFKMVSLKQTQTMEGMA